MNKKNQTKTLIEIFIFFVVLGVIGISIDHFDWFLVLASSWIIVLGHLILQNQVEFGRETLDKLEDIKN